jgi:hypothetical protein
MMIRVARVWAHRSPSGPSFRRPLPATGSEASVQLRAGGPARREPPPQQTRQHPSEEPRKTGLR